MSSFASFDPFGSAVRLEESKYDSESNRTSRYTNPQPSSLHVKDEVKSPHAIEFAQMNTYRTPFDSPDPILAPAEAPAPAPASVVTLPTVTVPGGPPLHTQQIIQQAQQNNITPVEIDEDNIFHRLTSITNPTPTANENPSDSLPANKPRTTKAHSVQHQKRAPKPFPTTGAAASSSSSSASKAGTAVSPRSFDPVEFGLIPDILTSRELLNRRASEPTLGSRRAAAAAAAAAAAKQQQQHQHQQQSGKEGQPNLSPAASTPRQGQGSSTPRRQLHIDVGGQLSTPDASDVNLAGPFHNVDQGPVTPRRTCSKCSHPSFASNLCATHLTQSAEPATPTTMTRFVHNLWQRRVETTSRLALSWVFWKKGDKYAVQLWQDNMSPERTVIVNGKMTYRGTPQEAEWRLSMVLGRSKSSAFETILGAIPKGANGTGEMVAGWSYDSPYEFELWIDGFPFTEARTNWLSELGSQLMIQQEESGSISASDLHQQHYSDLQYIHSNWTRTQTMNKTSMGYRKQIVEWKFTIRGKKHFIILAHSETSGKRTLTLDGRPILTKKPGLITGLLLKRSMAHRFELDGLNIEVRIQKMDWSDSVRSSSSSSGGGDTSHPPFIYELFIDRVAFQRCTKTLAEYAGGDLLIEEKISARKKEEAKRKKREAELKRDPRAIPSPEPIDEAKS